MKTYYVLVRLDFLNHFESYLVRRHENELNFEIESPACGAPISYPI